MESCNRIDDGAARALHCMAAALQPGHRQKSTRKENPGKDKRKRKVCFGLCVLFSLFCVSFVGWFVVWFGLLSLCCFVFLVCLVLFCLVWVGLCVFCVLCCFVFLVCVALVCFGAGWSACCFASLLWAWFGFCVLAWLAFFALFCFGWFVWLPGKCKRGIKGKGRGQYVRQKGTKGKEKEKEEDSPANFGAPKRSKRKGKGRGHYVRQKGTKGKEKEKEDDNMHQNL